MLDPATVFDESGPLEDPLTGEVPWTASFSLCGEVGSEFWVAERGYPDIGVYFADCRRPATT